ncbi:non-hydrolyzing UDP-N-acetylglucosamine 2-epimerase [Desulfocastanea catecholica]
MKIVTVIGARPQFIKAAAVSRAIAAFNSLRDNTQSIINEIIVHTGQHFDSNMSDVFFTELQIPQPSYNLQIGSVNHGAMTGRMLEKIEEILFNEKPDGVMVYGDTNSTLAGALAAKKNHIKVVHVEAGLRSYNMDMPEEINRILTDRISDILCCPTDNAIENLEKEGFKLFPCTIAKTGDVMQDAALYYSTFSAKKSSIIKNLGLEKDEFILCTIHRAENTDDSTRLKGIITALNDISKKIRIVLPMHPRTRKKIAELSYLLEFKIIDPVGYFDIIELLKHAKMVMTDSGGLQKEAYFFNKICITLRNETEWVELIELGVNRLVGAIPEKIISTQVDVMNIEKNFDSKLYGNGMAGKNIVELIAKTIVMD